MSPAIPQGQLAAMLHQANALHGAGRLGDAARLYRQALALAPELADAWHRLAAVLLQAGQAPDAAEAARRAARLQPNAPEIYVTLGGAQRQAGQLDGAIDSYRRALRLRPGFTEVHFNLGNLYLQAGRPDDATAAYRRALAARPAYHEARNNLGHALLALGQAEEALACFRAVLAVLPDSVEAHANVGSAQAALGQHAAAAAAFRAGLARLTPQTADPQAERRLLAVLSDALANLMRLEEAEAVLLRILELAPGDRPTLWNLATNRLARGDFESGFALHENRFGTVQPDNPFTAPLWQGEALAGRTILVHADQGYGDTLQHCRFLRHVAARGGRVVAMVQQALLGVVARVEGVEWVVRLSATPPAHDVQIPIASLPGALRIGLADLPDRVGYVQADPARLAQWRERLAGVGGLKVGLCWAGTAANPMDAVRSMTADMLAPLMDVAGVSFVSLQKDAGDAAALPGLLDWSAALADFEDTAGLVGNLDLVITVDTAVGHLAGAMGRTVWLLNRFNSEWRWLVGRADSPWYPGHRVFRQTRFGDWGGVVGEVAEALRKEAVLF